MKKISLFILLITSYTLALSQSRGIGVTGTVADKKNAQPIEYATVQLFSKSPRSLIKTAITNKRGKFAIDSIATGTYIVSVNYMGLAAPEKEYNFTSTTNMGTIEMELATNTLSDVTVTAKKNMLNTSIDRNTECVGKRAGLSRNSSSRVFVIRHYGFHIITLGCHSS